MLDIGAWDGWFSFEMERRGASVLAVDSARQKTFFEAKKLLNSKVEYLVEDICYLTPKEVGYFDIVLFFGVLYHLKHPLLALERVCELTTDLACIETLVTDDPPNPHAIPLLEFYETTELAGQFDNWCGPNTSCLMAYMRTAGFANARLLGEHDCRAQAVGYRKWPAIPRSGAGPQLKFASRIPGPAITTSAATATTTSPSGLRAAETGSRLRQCFRSNGTVRMPPGGSSQYWRHRLAGELQTSLRPVAWMVRRHGGAEKLLAQQRRARIPIDLSRAERRVPGPVMESIVIAGVADGKTFEANSVRGGVESCVSVWAAGLPESAARADITIRLDGTDLPATYLSGPDERANCARSTRCCRRN